MHRRRRGQEEAQRADSRCDCFMYGTPPFIQEEVEKGMSTIIDSDLPRLKHGELVLPLQQRHDDTGLYSFELTLASANIAMTMSAAYGVNVWHRRMGHLNAQSL